jgi:hypothetical protein
VFTQSGKINSNMLPFSTQSSNFPANLVVTITARKVKIFVCYVPRFQNVLIFMPLHQYTWLLGATTPKVTYTHSLWQIKYQHTLRTGRKWVCKLTAVPNEQRLVGSRCWWLIWSGRRWFIAKQNCLTLSIISSFSWNNQNMHP